MADLFISYRRQDSASATGRLAERLQAHFGAERVFRDHDSIVPGTDFEATLQRALAGARAVLVVVGRHWLDAADAAGRRRLDDPTDMVRIEVAAALAAGVPVIPVLVEGASMPAAAALPAPLQAFARCQAVELSEIRWAYDSGRLIEVLVAQHGLEPAAGGVAGIEHAGRSWPRRTGGLLLDLLELLASPRRLMLRRAGGGSVGETLPAAAMLVLCLALGNALLALVIGRPLADTVAAGIVFGLFCSALLSAPLALAWRLAGQRAGWRRVSTLFAYVAGGAWLYGSAGMAVFALGLRLVDLALFDRLLALLGQGQAAGAPMQPMLAQAAQQAVRGPALAAFVVANVVWLAGLVWCVAAWGALRIAFGAGRPTAAAATLLWAAMVGAIAAAAAWAAGR